MTTTSSITAQLHALQGLNTPQLRSKYCELFGEETHSHNREFLFKRIAWRLQEQAYGGLSQRTKTRLSALVDESLIRVRPPKDFRPRVDIGAAPAPDTAEPTAGKIISRLYKGRLIEVEVLDNGFYHDGMVYSSLSAVAKCVTGSHCSGRAFFGLAGKERG